MSHPFPPDSGGRMETEARERTKNRSEERKASEKDVTRRALKGSRRNAAGTRGRVENTLIKRQRLEVKETM